MMKYVLTSILLAITILQSCLLPEEEKKKTETVFDPKFTLTPSDTFYFKSFVDCNMAEAWIGDTFRIFPGKYGRTLYGAMMKT